MFLRWRRICTDKFLNFFVDFLPAVKGFLLFLAEGFQDVRSMQGGFEEWRLDGTTQAGSE